MVGYEQICAFDVTVNYVLAVHVGHLRKGGRKVRKKLGPDEERPTEENGGVGAKATQPPVTYVSHGVVSADNDPFVEEQTPQLPFNPSMSCP